MQLAASASLLHSNDCKTAAVQHTRLKFLQGMLLMMKTTSEFHAIASAANVSNRSIYSELFLYHKCRANVAFCVERTLSRGLCNRVVTASAATPYPALEGLRGHF